LPYSDGRAAAMIRPADTSYRLSCVNLYIYCVHALSISAVCASVMCIPLCNVLFTTPLIMRREICTESARPHLHCHAAEQAKQSRKTHVLIEGITCIMDVDLISALASDVFSARDQTIVKTSTGFVVSDQPVGIAGTGERPLNIYGAC
jgi:hypothetical protein